MCQMIKENLIHGSFKYGFSMTSSMSHLEYVSKLLCLYFYLPATCFISLLRSGCVWGRGKKSLMLIKAAFTVFDKP